MTPYQINSYLLRHFEGDLHEIADPGNGAILRPGSRALTVCVLAAGAGATTRILADPDDLPYDQEIMLIATGITGANTITIQGRQGTEPTHVFTENGTAIFRVSQEGVVKIWFLVADGAMSSSGLPPDGVYEDITVSGGGTIWEINATNGATIENNETGSGTVVGLNLRAVRNDSGVVFDLVAGDAQFFNNNVSGSVLNGIGIDVEMKNTGTVTDAKGFNVVATNVGTFTNTYGYYAGDLTSGTQTNQAYSFYASDANARSFFAGNTGFGTMTEPQETISSSGPICTYNTFVSASNYERGCIRFTANVFTIATEQAGAGTLRDMALLRGTVEHIRLKATETVVNDGGSNIDFRVEGLGLTHMIFVDASASTENLALNAGSAPNWQTMNGGLFIGNALGAPTGNPANGYFLYGNAGVPTFRTSGGVITPIDFGIVSSGTYTPTLTNVANLTGSTAYQCQFMRVGSTVTVSGKVDTDVTSGGLATELGISLPIASNFGAEEDCAGVTLDTGLGERAAVKGDTTNDRARIQWTAANDLNTWFFTFTYQII